MAKKPKMTRRLKIQYEAVLNLDTPFWMWYPPSKKHVKHGKFDHDFGWGAWAFAKQWQCRRDVDIKKLQKIVIKFGNPYTIYAFARDVKEANINRLQKSIIYSGNPEVMRMFADNIPGANQSLLRSMADIAEIMVIW